MTNAATAGPARIPILDPLRGIAALAVMWFHFTQGDHLLDQGGWTAALLKSSGTYGWAGVEFFFVISGFVLPYALLKGQYRLRNYGTFLLKRLTRLEPPYLVSIALALGLWFLGASTPWFRGQPFDLEWPRLFLHLGYLNSYFGFASYIPIYWTLAIEFQFYLSIALLFPLIVHPRRWLRDLLPVALAVLSRFPSRPDTIFHCLPLFCMGIATFQHYAGLAPRRVWVGQLVVAAAFCLATMGGVATAAGLSAALLIGLSTSTDLLRAGRGQRLLRALGWAGTVSYSLYLVHIPIGGRVVGLGARFNPGLGLQCLTLAAAILASLVAAWVLHRLVERPSQRWSSLLRFGKPTP